MKLLLLHAAASMTAAVNMHAAAINCRGNQAHHGFVVITTHSVCPICSVHAFLLCNA
jgi:hypothetical protein